MLGDKKITALFALAALPVTKLSRFLNGMEFIKTEPIMICVAS